MITTATDVNGKFAVDLFASAYHMTIIDRKEAKNISAAVLEGKQIGVFSDLPIKKLPDGFVMDRWCEENICITVNDEPFRKKVLFASCSQGGCPWCWVPQRNRSGIYERKVFAH